MSTVERTEIFEAERPRLVGIAARVLSDHAEAEDAAILAGTPSRIEGRREVAEFFNGSAHAALAVFTGDRPGAAWFHRGETKVLFDFTVVDGLVRRVTFRAEPEVLAQVARRDGKERRG